MITMADEFGENALEDAVYDVVLDKATLDTLMCAQGYKRSVPKYMRP